jgi:hypothetical protein
MAYRNRAPQLLLAGGLLLAASPAFAQEGVLFQRLMNGVLGNDKEEIDYRQRPPLVVPPSSALPRPQGSPAERNAAWPNDPDVAARREATAAARTPSALNEKFRNNPMLTQQELRQGRTSRDTGRPVIAEDQNTYNNQIQPIQLGRELAARRSHDDTTKLTYGGEPQRRLLSEPPTGYRRPAGTAALGPGRMGPLEDKQAVGQREFLTGQIPTQ